MKMSHETTAKTLQKIADAIKAYRAAAPASVHVCISAGNNKIGRALNVSLAPGYTCGNCSGCLPYCYDLRDCMAHGKNVINARARNTVLAMERRGQYFAEIREKLNAPRRAPRLFRWHVGGEIPDVDYFAGMVEIAREFPEWRFWTYTKMHTVINSYVATHGGSRAAAIPENLSVMFSVWDGMPTINPYDFPTFSCVADRAAAVASGAWVCPGNCETCYNARRGCPFGESGAVVLH